MNEKLLDKNQRPHSLGLFHRAILKDSKGKILLDTGEKPSKSFVEPFLVWVYSMFSTLQLAVTDTAGAERVMYGAGAPCNNFFNVNALANDSDFGIVIGTGDTAETNTDWKLETQLTEGVGGGQITHGACAIGVTAIVDVNVDLALTRTFTNNTGAGITVKEAGIYEEDDVYNWFHMIVRDVLPTPILVPDTCSLSVIYTMRSTV